MYHQKGIIKPIHAPGPGAKTGIESRIDEEDETPQRSSTAAHSLQPLSETLRQSSLTKLPGIEQTLLGQVDALDVRHVVRRRTADARGNKDGVGLEDDTVVDDLVDSQGDEVVVLDDSALVSRAPME